MKKKECLFCGGTEDLELAHMLSYKLTKIMIIRQFNGGLKLQGTKEHGTMRDLISRVRRQKGDVWLCQKHHMYSDRQQEIMVKMLSKDISPDLELDSELPPFKKGGFLFHQQHLILNKVVQK